MQEIEQTIITSPQYWKQYVPGPGFLLIDKDPSPDKSGGIYIPPTAKNLATKYSATGVIRAVSPFKANDDHDQYLSAIYREGDRVGFSATVPITSPVPPTYKFENPNREQDRSVIIHVADVIGVLCETEEQKKEFLDRFNV